MIGQIVVVSHRLWSLLGGIMLIVLRVFVCGVEYFDVYYRLLAAWALFCVIIN